ncbi:MAG TPA: hypothetical protein PLU58_11560 [Saprospiraceae bacterium]|nr:hypothetical protein [Saprospiraceae bacterium]
MANNKNSIFTNLTDAKDTFPFSSVGTGAVAIAQGSTNVVGTGTLARSEAKAGDYLADLPNDEIRKIILISSDLSFSIEKPFSNAFGIASTDTITDVDQGLKTFTVAGDQTLTYTAGSKFYVTGSTGNDGLYTVDSVSYGTATEIIVLEAIPDATVDGDISFATSPVYVPSSEYCEIGFSILSTAAAGEIDGNPLPPGIGVTWGKTGRTRSANMDMIDPFILDATGTVIYIQALK